eukprot:TRINITY_DN15592_c0_g1_i1.p1 TRINITY_DN15592_c0_g1~~TRINITY_DN15592_c0_g1_i1.p1  ORF type:complete len:232 (+),score=38.69 TRINITY_DN15592_c0_g1_i1:256-951(+)
MASKTRKAKLVHFVINFLLLLLAGVLVFAGVYGLTVRDASKHFVGGLVYGVLALGLIFAGVALLGALGAKRETKRLMYTYVIVLFILMAGEVAFIVVGKGNEGKLPSVMDSKWTDFGDANRNWYQKEFKCCGYEILSDRTGSNCCRLNVNCAVSQPLSDYKYDRPCQPELQAWVDWIINVSFILTVIALVVQLVGLVNTFVVIKLMGDRRAPDSEENNMIPLTKVPQASQM